MGVMGMAVKPPVVGPPPIRWPVPVPVLGPVAEFTPPLVLVPLPGGGAVAGAGAVT
jgi:hypothetical protein